MKIETESRIPTWRTFVQKTGSSNISTGNSGLRNVTDIWYAGRFGPS